MFFSSFPFLFYLKSLDLLAFLLTISVCAARRQAAVFASLDALASFQTPSGSYFNHTACTISSHARAVFFE